VIENVAVECKEEEKKLDDDGQESPLGPTKIQPQLVKIPFGG
jgi:hypothetical protein